MAIYGNSVGNKIFETDPTVPQWAKTEQKPTYTIEDINLQTETWTFTLSDGSTVTKNVVIK